MSRDPVTECQGYTCYFGDGGDGGREVIFYHDLVWGKGKDGQLTVN